MWRRVSWLVWGSLVAASLGGVASRGAGDITPAGGSSSSSCPSCRMMRDELRLISLESIKEQILNKLGMKQAPNMTGRTPPHIPPLDHLWDQHMISDQPFKPGPSVYDEFDDYSATTEKVIAFAQPHPKIRHRREQDVLFFKFSQKVQENRVVKAQLWLYLKGGGPIDDPPPVTINIYRIILNSPNPDNCQKISSSKEARPSGGGGRWVAIEVKRLVETWFKYPRDNLSLLVEVRLPGHEPAHSQHLIVTSQHQDPSKVPFLEVHTMDGRRARTKRTIGLNCQANSRERKCCRYPLTVNFEDFGWDFVIAPKKYEANFCSGECHPVYLPKNPHTHIIQMASPKGSTGPCCAPRKLSSISMLYFDDESNIIYGLLPDMVVELCGCS